MDAKGFDTINVIPFIDIMLVLLAIVLTTATFIASGAIPIELPRADAPAAEIREMLKIEIDRNGQLFLDASPLTIDELEGTLAASDRQRPVVVRADRRVALQAFVEVMNLLRQFEFSRVSLLTEAL